MIYPLEIFFRKLRRKFSRNEWALRQLRLSTSEGTGSDPGILLIQIDGLSRTQLERALARGRMPFLRSLITRQHYELVTFYSGIPSSTPAVQGELFYGVRSAVPAFSFMARPASKVIAMFMPEWAKRIETNLKERGEGLLRDGSSWSNIYTGGAAPEESHFCAASLGPGDFLKSISLFGLISIIILQFPAVLRLVVLLGLEVLIALWDVLEGLFHGEKLFYEMKFVISRVFVCLGLREVVTIGAGVDLARGLPIVHVNFLGYDEHSHRRGPQSAFAHWSLKGIDFAIRKLYQNAQRSTRRDYQVWIFSDHGQERARSFYEEFPGGIEHTVEQGLNHMERWVDERKAHVKVRQFAENRHYAPHFSLAWRDQVKRERIKGLENWSFSVTAMGPVGHLYLERSMTLEEKREFANWLVHHGKVPGVVYETGPGEATWVHHNGIWKLPEDAERLLPHPGRLKQEIAQDLTMLVCEQPYAGNFVLLGWTLEGTPWTFAMERGAHAGPGTEETRGFAILPGKTRLPKTASEFIRPSDLRLAVLHRLGRQRLPAKKAVTDLIPVRSLRVMTYNVHSCMGMDGKISPHRIARVIDTYDPDVVALQEIDLGRVRTRGHDQARMIAEELNLHVCFCPTVVHGNELYGHALLSKYPIEVLHKGRISCGNREGRCEPRGAVLVKVSFGAEDLYILNTHFGLGRHERVAQASDLMSEKWLGKIGIEQPLIVCGDFNMMPGSIPYRALASRLHDVQTSLKNYRPRNTFAALFPFSRIDHIFVSGHFDVENVYVPQTHLTRVASDHLPLVADLILKG